MVKPKFTQRTQLIDPFSITSRRSRAMSNNIFKLSGPSRASRLPQNKKF